MSKILVVDDNPQIIRLLSISLTKAGFNVLYAYNGKEGLELFQEQKPDIVISDIMMPNMDGIEFCMHIREGDVKPMIPFIFMTSVDSSDMEVKGYRAGADDYIQKPVEREELLKRVNKLLERQEKVDKIGAKSAVAEKGLFGNLEEITIIEIIQLIHLNHRSGALNMFNGEDMARILFLKGNMFRIEGAYGEGEGALPVIVGIREGRFAFEAEKNSFPGVEKNIEAPTMSVLMEACRLFDESTK